jgi:hypothetical protein
LGQSGIPHLITSETAPDAEVAQTDEFAGLLLSPIGGNCATSSVLRFLPQIQCWKHRKPGQFALPRQGITETGNRFDRRYGARPLKRAIERHLVIPLSNLIATRQVAGGEVVYVDADNEAHELSFKKAPRSTMAQLNPSGAYNS